MTALAEAAAGVATMGGARTPVGHQCPIRTLAGTQPASVQRRAKSHA